jgi:hypothetical protein
MSVSPGGPEAKSEGQRRATTERGRQFGMGGSPLRRQGRRFNAADHAIAYDYRRTPSSSASASSTTCTSSRRRDYSPHRSTPCRYLRIRRTTSTISPSSRAASASALEPHGHEQAASRIPARLFRLDVVHGRAAAASRRYRQADSPKTRSSSSGRPRWNSATHALAEDVPHGGLARVPLLISAPGRRATAKCTAASPSSSTSITLAQPAASRPPISPELPGAGARQPGPPGQESRHTQLAYEKITGRSVRTDRYRYIR